MSGLLAGKVWLSALAPHLKPLAATLADIANDDGTSIHPGLEYVAWRLGASIRTVSRNIGELLEQEILQVVSPAHHHQKPEYKLHEEKLPKRESWRQSRKKKRVDTMSTLKTGEGRHERQSGWTPTTGRVDTDDSSGWTFGADSPPVSLNDPSDDPSLDPSRKREMSADADALTASGLVTLWNLHREPGPTVSKLTSQRRRLYERALRDEPDITDWRTAILWLNRQAYANACGTGDHATWRATLDWLAKPGQLAKVLEQAHVDLASPPPRARRPGDLPTTHVTPAQRDIARERQQRVSEFQQQQEARAEEAAALVLGLSAQARRVLEREALAELEPYRDRLSATAFDDMVLQALPRILVVRADGRALADVAAELERGVVAA